MINRSYIITGPFDEQGQGKYNDVGCDLVIDKVQGKDEIKFDESDKPNLDALLGVGCVLYYADPWAGCDSGTVELIDGIYYWVSNLK